jgi:hypothetical protein
MTVLDKIKDVVLSASSSRTEELVTKAGVLVKRQIYILPYGMWKDVDGRRLCEITLFIEGVHSTTHFMSGPRFEGLGSDDGMRDGGEMVTSIHSVIGGEFSFSTAIYATQSGKKCVIYKEDDLLEYSL